MENSMLSLACTLTLCIIFCAGCGRVKDGDSSKESNALTSNEEIGQVLNQDVRVAGSEKRKRKRRLIFKESIAKKDVEMRYPEHKVIGSERGDSSIVFWLSNKHTHSQDFFIRYNPDGTFIESIDLIEMNPFKDFINYGRVDATYHHMLGNNVLINGKKEKVKGEIPSLLYSLTPEDFFISVINPFVVSEVSLDKTKVLIRFSYHLLPSDEILEHQTYPGLNTYLIVDINTGEILHKIENLPFVPYYEALTNDGKYLVVAHTQDMTDNDYSTKEKDWKHQASVYNCQTGALCFRIEGASECMTLVNSKLGLVGLNCYDLTIGFQDTVTQYYLKDGYIISRDRDMKEGGVSSKKSTQEYQAIRTKEGAFIKYYYNKDFNRVQKICEW